MRILILCILIFCIPAVTAETVYRIVDENGQTHFSDKPTPGADEIQVKDAQSLSQPDPGRFTYTPKSTELAQHYTEIAITSPENDTAFRDNTGNLSVSIALEPSLDSGSGHQVALYMDGTQVSVGKSLQFNLDNLDRGTHTLKASVINSLGKALISSSPVSFTILRYHQ